MYRYTCTDLKVLFQQMPQSRCYYLAVRWSYVLKLLMSTSSQVHGQVCVHVHCKACPVRPGRCQHHSRGLQSQEVEEIRWGIVRSCCELRHAALQLLPSAE